MKMCQLKDVQLHSEVVADVQWRTANPNGKCNYSNQAGGVDYCFKVLSVQKRFCFCHLL